MRTRTRVILAAVAILASVGSALPAPALNVGDKAPDFELPATTQEKFRMSDLRGKNVLLFGFVGAWTPTRTTEVAAFELDLPKFESRNTQVVGISSDFPWSSSAWAEKMGLTFPVVSDWQRKTEAYGILDTDPKSLVYRYAKRAYLIIDGKGIVRYKRILDDPTKLIENDELLAELDKIGR